MLPWVSWSRSFLRALGPWASLPSFVVGCPGNSLHRGEALTGALEGFSGRCHLGEVLKGDLGFKRWRMEMAFQALLRSPSPLPLPPFQSSSCLPSLPLHFLGSQLQPLLFTPGNPSPRKPYLNPTWAARAPSLPAVLGGRHCTSTPISVRCSS